MILSFVLEKTTEELILLYNCDIKDFVANEQFKRFEELIELRCARVPIAYILGEKEFYSRNFYVNENVLIPRPDSEILIDYLLLYLKNNNLITEQLNILDLGVGSGCLLLTMLAELQNSSGIGVDISQEAVNLATKNAKNLGLNNRCNFICCDWLDYSKFIKINENIDSKYDIIISNPPYIDLAECKDLEPEISYEPEIALYAQNNGLLYYEQISQILPEIMNKKSIAVLEHGATQSFEVAKIITQKTDNKLKILDNIKDLAGNDRAIVIHI